MRLNARFGVVSPHGRHDRPAPSVGAPCRALAARVARGPARCPARRRPMTPLRAPRGRGRAGRLGRALGRPRRPAHAPAPRNPPPCACQAPSPAGSVGAGAGARGARPRTPRRAARGEGLRAVLRSHAALPRRAARRPGAATPAQACRGGAAARRARALCAGMHRAWPGLDFGALCGAQSDELELKMAATPGSHPGPGSADAARPLPSGADTRIIPPDGGGWACGDFRGAERFVWSDVAGGEVGVDEGPARPGSPAADSPEPPRQVWGAGRGMHWSVTDGLEAEPAPDLRGNEVQPGRRGASVADPGGLARRRPAPPIDR